MEAYRDVEVWNAGYPINRTLRCLLDPNVCPYVMGKERITAPDKNRIQIVQRLAVNVLS
jgi:hypothetical protein